jgi:hypothetical protein
MLSENTIYQCTGKTRTEYDLTNETKKKLPRLEASRKRPRPTGRVHLSAYIF